MGTIPFQPPPGFVYDDTSFSSPARYKTGSRVRFVNGQWQVIGGWEALTTSTLTGGCACGADAGDGGDSAVAGVLS